MYIRNKFRNLSSALKHIALKSPNISAAPTNTAVNTESPITSTACPPSTKTRFGDWPQFYDLRKTLEERETDEDWLVQTRWVGNFVEYLDEFDDKLLEHQEYGIILFELATLCEEMKQFYSRDVPPEMTNATRGLYLMIEHELFYLKDKCDNASSQTHDIGEHDIDFVITCYRRMQNCLRRILLNMKAGENGNTVDTVDMSHLFEHASIVQFPRHKVGYHDKFKIRSCAAGTRINVLSRINTWINDPSSGSVYWINGMAGTGKTAIASSLCKQLNEEHKLAASHFCCRSLWCRCQDSRLIIPSLAYQIAGFSWPFRNALLKILRLKDPEWHHNSHSPDALFVFLVSQPLLEIRHTLPDCLVVVIDAIDECTDKEFSRQVLEVLIAGASSLPIKFVICGRPEPQVRGPMDHQNNQEVSRIALHELDQNTVQADIETYLRGSLPLDAVWPVLSAHSKHNVKVVDMIPTLAQQSGYLFIWAAILQQEISARGSYMYGIALEEALIFPFTCKASHLSNEAYYKGIKAMYACILQAALDETSLKEEHIRDIRLVLHLVVCTKGPIEIHRVSKLLKWNDTNRVWAALRPLWSVLHVSESIATVEVLHPSFCEYMLDPLHSGEYCCDLRILPLHCFRNFQHMHPGFNICGLKSSYIPDSKATGLEQQVQNIPIHLFNAAQHWSRYLGLVSASPSLLRELKIFLSSRLLQWMEVMTLKGGASKMPETIRLAKEWAESNSACSKELRALIHDAWRFTMTFTLGMVFTSTPHLYVSMLPFCSTYNSIAKSHAGHTQGMLEIEGTALDRQQGTLLVTWRFGNAICSPVISPDGSQIAVGVGHDVRILNASDGQPAFPPFQGHSDMVLSVRFSPDGTRIVSSSLDHTIRVWILGNGMVAFTPIENHTEIINSVAFSPDGLFIASGSQDGNFMIWDSLTGASFIGPLTEHSAIREVKYAPHGRWVATCTRNGIVTRSAKDGKALQVFFANNNSAPYCSMDISPDCTRIASATIENSIYMWDVESGQMLLGPLSPGETAYDYEPFVSVSFSPDGSLLASSSPDRSLYLWDTKTGNLLDSSMKGHTNSITSVSFSPDGTYIISGSHDNTLRLWSVQNISSKLEPLPGHINPVAFVGFSCDGARIVSGSIDGNIRVWDSQSGDMFLSCSASGHTGRVLNAYSAVKHLILSYSPAGLILLDFQTGRVAIGPIQLDHDQSIQSAVFSTDGSCIILASTRNAVRVLAADTGDTRLEFCAPITSQSRWAHITSIASSPDGSRVAIGSMHYSFSIHDVYSGQLLYGPFDGYTNKYNALAFSPDGTRIVSGSFSTVQVQDVQSGEIVLGPLKRHMGWVTSVDYSPDGTHIVSGARDSSICVWDAQTGEPVIGPVKWHTGAVNSVKFSPDGTRIVSGSDDKTIRMTNVRRDLDFLSDSSTPTGTDWKLSEGGWVEDKERSLLVWVPPDLRTTLTWPRTELLISTRGWLRMNFANARIGETWIECYKPLLYVSKLMIGSSSGREYLNGEADKAKYYNKYGLKGVGERSPTALPQLTNFDLELLLECLVEGSPAELS